MPNSTYEYYGPNAGALSTPEIRNLNKLVNQAVDAHGGSNIPLLMELVGEATTLTAVALGGGGAAATPEQLQAAFKATDERWNPQLYAQNSVNAMAALGNFDIDPTTDLAAFEANVVQRHGRTKDPENLAAVKLAGREILAGRHVDKMGPDIDIVDPDAYIALGRLTPAGNPRIDASLEAQIKSKAEAKRVARIAQVTADYPEKMTKAQVLIIISKPGIHPQIKSALQKLIDPAIKEGKTKTESGTQALIIGAMTPDAIAAHLKTTAAYTGASIEVQDAIDAQLEVNKISRDTLKANEPGETRINDLEKWESKLNYYKSLAKEWIGRLKIALPIPALVFLAFVIGGPAFVGAGATAGAIAGGVFLEGLLAASVAAIPFSIGIKLSGFSPGVIASEKAKLLAKKAERDAQKKTPVLEANRKRRVLAEKITAIQQFAQVFAQGKGYDAELVTKEIMKGTKTDNVEALLKAIS